MTPGDRLLYAISAKRELGWSVFKRTFELLCAAHAVDASVTDMGFARYETARGLDALAHVEVEIDFDSGTRLYAAPPTLSLLPRAGLPKAILSGARSPNSIDVLGQRIKEIGRNLQIEVREQAGKVKRFPARVSIAAESTEDLASIAKAAGVEFQRIPVSWSILNFSASLPDYLSGCNWARTDKLNWDEQQFDVDRVCFTENNGSLQDTQLIRYIHPSRQYPIYYLWKGMEAVRVDPDWGRFAILETARRDILHYDHSVAALFLPVTVPLPKLLARALCLCSGFAPRVVSSNGVVGSELPSTSFRVYGDIPPEFARVVAAKIGQKLIEDVSLLEPNDD